jgi:hypothetical protein
MVLLGGMQLDFTHVIQSIPECAYDDILFSDTQGDSRFASERRPRFIPQEKRQRFGFVTRPCVILDLDETLVHSILLPSKCDNPPPQRALWEPLPDSIMSWYGETIFRPWVDDALALLSVKFDLAVMTMASRSYALPLIDCIDPTHTIFCDRIATRDDLLDIFAEDTESIHKFALPEWGGSQNCVAIDDYTAIWDPSVTVINVPMFLGDRQEQPILCMAATFLDMAASILERSEILSPRGRRDKCAKHAIMDRAPDTTPPTFPRICYISRPIGNVMRVLGGEWNKNMCFRL